MRCNNCGKDLGGMDQRVAFICLEIMGDEYIESYWRCDACGNYMTETYHDHFLGEDDISSGSLPADRGQAIVDKIRQCPHPDHKRCKCPVHQELNR